MQHLISFSVFVVIVMFAVSLYAENNTLKQEKYDEIQSQALALQDQNRMLAEQNEVLKIALENQPIETQVITVEKESSNRWVYVVGILLLIPQLYILYKWIVYRSRKQYYLEMQAKLRKKQQEKYYLMK